VARGYVPLLLSVALIWGASFMFIKVAVEEIAPAAAMALRLAFAGLFLVPFLLVQQGVRQTVAGIRGTGRGAIFLGFMNAALPFTLISWGEQHVDSSIAAIGNSPVPIFVALLAIRFQHSERIRGLRLAGVVLGFVGVAVLAGFQPEGSWLAVAGTLACVAAALAYAISNLFTQRRYRETQPLVLVTAASLAGAALLTPLALFQLPNEIPSGRALGSVAALGIAGTAIAMIIFFRMLASYGASRASLVTYLVPVTAIAYGVFLLDERLSASAIVGLVLILGGVALGSGVFRFGRGRREAVPAAPHA
jgi:drug/metabolite transporter (DMT)-like permease